MPRRGLKLVECLDLYQVHGAQKGLILCFGIWQMFLLTSLTPFWCESGTFFFVYFQVIEAVTFKGHHFSDHKYSIWPVVHSFHSWVYILSTLIQFNNLTVLWLTSSVVLGPPFRCCSWCCNLLAVFVGILKPRDYLVCLIFMGMWLILSSDNKVFLLRSDPVG